MGAGILRAYLDGFCLTNQRHFTVTEIKLHAAPKLIIRNVLQYFDSFLQIEFSSFVMRVRET